MPNVEMCTAPAPVVSSSSSSSSLSFPVPILLSLSRALLQLQHSVGHTTTTTVASTTVLRLASVAKEIIPNRSFQCLWRVVVRARTSNPLEQRMIPSHHTAIPLGRVMT